MAFNLALDDADKRLKAEPSKQLMAELYDLIAKTATPIGDGTYKVRGYVSNYSTQYDRWMHDQGITDIYTMRCGNDDDGTTKYFITFRISRVTL